MGLVSGWEPAGGRQTQDRVNEGEYGGCILYSCMKIEQ
jgi:hypothetical protein